MWPPLVFVTYIVVCEIPIETEENFDDLSMINISPFVRYRSQSSVNFLSRYEKTHSVLFVIRGEAQKYIRSSSSFFLEILSEFILG